MEKLDNGIFLNFLYELSNRKIIVPFWGWVLAVGGERMLIPLGKQRLKFTLQSTKNTFSLQIKFKEHKKQLRKWVGTDKEKKGGEASTSYPGERFIRNAHKTGSEANSSRQSKASSHLYHFNWVSLPLASPLSPSLMLVFLKKDSFICLSICPYIIHPPIHPILKAY